MARLKISIAEHNSRLMLVKDLTAQLIAAKAAFEEAEQCEAMSNCQRCWGEGRVEQGDDDPAFNPNGDLLYKNCPDCNGKGYID